MDQTDAIRRLLNSAAWWADEAARHTREGNPVAAARAQAKAKERRNAAARRMEEQERWMSESQ